MEIELKRNYEKFTTFASDCDEMIIGNHLRLFSICEHHLLPFYGEDLHFSIIKIAPIDLYPVKNAMASVEWFLVENDLLGGHIKVQQRP
jgi:GTP cyclohydrolase I